MTRFDFQHAFQREHLLFRTWPFLVTMLFAWALLPLTPDHRDPSLLVIAAMLNLAIVLAVVFVPWSRVRAMEVLPPLAWLVVLALMRHGTSGSTAGYSPLVLLTVLWIALYGRRWMLAMGVVATVVTLSLPALVGPADLYPDTELRRALLYGVVAALVGTAVHEVVAGLLRERAGRERAEAELTRRRAFELNDDVVQDLAVAKLSFEVGRTVEGTAALTRALDAGKRIISDMVEHSGRFERTEAEEDAPPADANPH